MELHSKLIQDATERFASLPGIGKKSALRFVLNLIKSGQEALQDLSTLLHRLSHELQYCKTCYTLTETEVCAVCQNTNRDASCICVVEDYRDVLALESSKSFTGLYHVLGGLISPMDGISPSMLHLDSLVHRVESTIVQEVILALNTSMEGETTAFYIFRKLAPFNVKLSSIARGLAVGDSLEFADEITLSRSIKHRVPFEGILQKD